MDTAKALKLVEAALQTASACDNVDDVEKQVDVAIETIKKMLIQHVSSIATRQ